jgi:DNA-binding transcriptional MerR regulator
MADNVRIAEVGRRLNVSPQYLRMLEWEGRIPPARRDYNGRLYFELDIAILRAMGVGQHPRRLKDAGEVVAHL